ELNKTNVKAGELINEAQHTPPRTHDYPEQMGRHPDETRARLTEIRDNEKVYGQKAAQAARKFLEELDTADVVLKDLRQPINHLAEQRRQLKRRPGVESNSGGTGGNKPPTQTPPAPVTAPPDGGAGGAVGGKTAGGVERGHPLDD